MAWNKVDDRMEVEETYDSGSSSDDEQELIEVFFVDEESLMVQNEYYLVDFNDELLEFEPFLFNAPMSSKLKKQSLNSGGKPPYSRRRLSTTAALLPATSKHKLQALAKDELLASLNLPLDLPEHHATTVSKEEEAQVSSRTSIEEERKRLEEQRIKVIEEMLETEKKYLSCLATLDYVFRRPMLEGGIVPEKDIKVIFPSFLIELQECHGWFMKELEESINNNRWHVGDTFVKLSNSGSDNLLQIYTGYVNAFPKSISTLSRYTRTSQKFRKFLEACAEDPACDSLDLTSFLLTPVQRLPRYVLLLRQLLKYTDADHPDLGYATEALSRMEGLIESLNGSIQNSMKVYSAGESERRKFIRRQNSRRRKKTKPTSVETRGSNSTIGRPSFVSQITPDAERFSGLDSPVSDRVSSKTEVSYRNIRRVVSEETNSKEQSLLHRRSSSTPDVLSSSDAMSRTSSNETENPVSFRSRNSDLRKSWRRSFGAMFSAMWSGKEEKDFESLEKIASPSIETRQSAIDSDTGTRNSLEQAPSSKGVARRKFGVAYPIEPTTPLESEDPLSRITDLELNNNDRRRKTSTSSKDKKRSSWLLMNNWRRATTPSTSDDENALPVHNGRLGHKTSLTRSTSSSVISDGYKASDLGIPSSPTLQRNFKTRLSGRSSGLSSFFSKTRQRKESCDVDSKPPSPGTDVTPVSIQEEAENQSTNLTTQEPCNFSSTVNRNPVVKRSPSISRKATGKTRRRSAPVQIPEEVNSDPKTIEQWSSFAKRTVPDKGHITLDTKTPSSPKESRGKIKKALRHIVGRTKS